MDLDSGLVDNRVLLNLPAGKKLCIRVYGEVEPTSIDLELKVTFTGWEIGIQGGPGGSPDASCACGTIAICGTNQVTTGHRNLSIF